MAWCGVEHRRAEPCGPLLWSWSRILHLHFVGTEGAVGIDGLCGRRQCVVHSVDSTLMAATFLEGINANIKWTWHMDMAIQLRVYKPC